jgi:hypothetical protein
MRKCGKTPSGITFKALRLMNVLIALSAALPRMDSTERDFCKTNVSETSRYPPAEPVVVVNPYRSIRMPRHSCTLAMSAR